MTAIHNLTRDEAKARAALLSVAAYDVQLDLTSAVTDATTFRSTTTVAFTCASPGAETFVDLVAERIDRIALNGRELDPAQAFDGRRIALTDLAESNELVVDAACYFMRTGEGLHRFVDPVDKSVYLYTQFETFDAHRMYACFDQPDLKATFAFTVSAPDTWEVVSNMPGRATAAAEGVRRWTFERSPRMSSYITAMVCGPYYHVHDEHDGIPLGLYCRASLAEHLDPDDLFTVTKQGFDFFHRAFDYRYPWPKYDQLFVPEFNAGAMENAGCVTFLEDYVFRSKVTDASYERRAETILHEMAHMWFGDLVTMRWWDDLWLNESFATYVSVLAMVEATRYTRGWTTFANTEKTWAYRQDQYSTTHPIASDIVDIEAVEVNFDGITYAKGASVLGQLTHWVGREAFLAGTREYFRRFEFANTTLQDLLDVLEEASGRDLSQWSKQWLETAGVNTLRARFEVSGEGDFTRFEVVQGAVLAEHPTLRAHRLAIGLYDRTSEGLLRREQVHLDVVGEVTEVPQLVGVRQPDLVLINDDDLTYAKIRLDERSLRTLTSYIGEFRDPLARAVCWAACWDMTRDAEMAARDYLTLVLAGIDAETDIGVVQSLLRQASSAVHLYSTDEFRPVGLDRLATAAREHLLAAEPGSDRQLAWTRAWATVARSADDIALLRGLLDGSRVPSGLRVDAELRWALVHRLCALGQLDADGIDREADRDPTAAGRRHALSCRAARPTVEAKDEAWELAMSADLPNAEQVAVITGFVNLDQRELLAPYAERYFASIDEVWRTRTNEMAQNIVVGLYPGYLVEQAMVDRTDAWIEANQPVPPLRRLLVEGREGVARALRARARDATSTPP